MHSDIPQWVGFVSLCLVSIAGAMLSPVLRNHLRSKRVSRKQDGQVQNWAMPEVTLISGKYRDYLSRWPNTINIGNRMLNVVDKRKDNTFTPHDQAIITLWVRPSDPDINRHAELWWADYGVHLDADEAVKEAERLVN